MTPAAAKEITKKAKPQYRKIIAKLPEFEKADRFQMNIVNCAMLVRVRPAPCRSGRTCRRLTDYYADVHDDAADAVVLPQERKKEVHAKRILRA